jgi:DNA polymerase-3 subunit delta'
MPLAAFEGAMASGALHHAWLLVGPQGIGKASFARHAARLLVEGNDRAAELIETRRHPDVHFLVREVWDKSRPPNIVPLDERKEDDAPARSIRVSQVRTLRGQMAKPPTLSPRRVVLLDAADDLEREGANALLKMLEEPPASTVFLLVSHAPGRLLPTIRSRCRLLRFDPLSDAEVTQVLRAERPDLEEDELAALVRAGDGSPGNAQRFAGLDVADLDRRLAALAASGDPGGNAIALADKLSSPSVQPRYEAFLDRAVRVIAAEARRREGPALRTALATYDEARDLAAAALGQSLDARGTAFEMAGLVARLAPPR